MIFLDPLHPTHSSIIQILGEQPKISTSKLFLQIKKNTKLKISKPNLYRIVSQLIEEQVLVKNKGKLSLNLVWVHQFQNFSETIQRNYSTNTLENISFPTKEKERKYFFADSLRNLDPFWNHLILGFHKLAPQKPFFVYNAHPWHILGMPDTEIRFQKSCTAKQNLYFLIGNDSFLDQHGEKLHRVTHCKTKITKNLPFPKEGYILWVCGNYLIEFLFPEILTRHFSLFFENVKSIKEFDAQLFSSIFDMKTRCKLSVTKDSEKAKKIETIFQKSFPSI